MYRLLTSYPCDVQPVNIVNVVVFPAANIVNVAVYSVLILLRW